MSLQELEEGQCLVATDAENALEGQVVASTTNETIVACADPVNMELVIEPNSGASCETGSSIQFLAYVLKSDGTKKISHQDYSAGL